MAIIICLQHYYYMPGKVHSGIFFCELRKLYTTRKNINCEDIVVVASKCHVDSLYHYFKQDSVFCKPTRSTIFKCPFFFK